VKFGAYLTYKSSDVEWLGVIPYHWSVDRLKRSIDGCRNGIWGEEADGGADDIICIRVADFDRVAFRVVPDSPTLRAVPRRERVARELKPGDLLIEKSGGGEKQLVGCVVSFDHRFEAVTSNFVARMRTAPGMCSRYWAYAHASMYSGRLNYPSIKQTTGIQNLDTAAYLNERFVYPPFDEQCTIADFLDRETARLDTLVRKRRELIEKLKEKRTALISRTVTRGLPADAARAAGLNPHPKHKSSGIEWLGDIPEHWEVKQLKWAVMFQRGHDLPSEQREEGDVPLVTSAGISSSHSRAAAKGPGIVTGRYGTIGVFHLISEDYWPLNTTLYTVSLRRNEPRFLRYMLTHLSPLFLLNAVKSAVPGVDRNDIHPTKAAVPPVPEQRAVADYLDSETAKLDRMMEKVEAAIEKLQEYRTALVTAAVTGKIDVRNSARAVDPSHHTH